MEYLRTYSVKLLQKKIIRTDDIKLSLYSEAMMSIKEKYGMEYTFKDLLKKSGEDGMAEGEAKGKNSMLETFRRLGVSEDIISKAAESVSI